MKKILLISICIVYSIAGNSQMSVYDCNVINPIVTQSEIDAVPYEYFKQCIEFGGGNNYLFNQISNKKITASTQITIKPGFHAGKYNPNGGMHLNILPKSDFDVAVMNYPDLNNILKYEKLELGIQLPTDILDKVNNYINEIPDVTQDQKLNPYLDWEIRVYAEFINYSVSQEIITVDGFYTKEFTSWSLGALPTPQNGDSYSNEEYESLGGWNEAATLFPFRIRFAPPTLGEWKARIKIVVNNVLVNTSEFFLFNVVESGNPGYVSVDDNRRFLKYNERTFYPIGCNLPWPETDEINDPELYDNLSYLGQDGVYYEIHEGYRDNYCVPRVYEKYKNVMNQLADNGANYFRMIMYPSATDIEWEKLGNYTDRLTMAKEMDDILNLAEDRNLFIHWDMQIQYTFSLSEVAYFRNWAWDNNVQGFPYCYKALIGTNDPVDFLTDENAKKYYKQRMRYILARWGYSTNIGIFELFSEINSLGNSWQLTNNWQKEMAAYMKSQYNGRIHLLTASYAGEKAIPDDIFEDANIDVMTSNIYDFGAPDFADFWIDNVSKKILNEKSDALNSYSKMNEKPMIFSESDPLDVICDFSAVEIQRAMWQSLFSGLAGSLSWEIRKHPHLFPIFGQMKNFISQIDLEEERWHPGASELNDFEWEYNEDFASNMDGEFNPSNGGKRERKADISYLRSGDGNYVIGVITNKTYNVQSTANCLIDLNWTLDKPEYSVLNTISNVNCEDEELKLRGLHNSKYYVNYFSPTNLSLPVQSSDDQGPKVKIEYTVNGAPEEFITLFMARRKNYNWIATQTDPILYNNLVSDTKQEVNTPQFDEMQNNDLETTDIIIYPIPASDFISIHTNQDFENLQIVITSLEGRIVTELAMSGNEHKIDVSKYEVGTYIFEFFLNGVKINQQKLIKI